MTTSSRKAMPWLVSIGLHACAVAVVAVLLAQSTAIAPVPPVVISLVGAPGPGRGALRRGGEFPAVAPSPGGAASASMRAAAPVSPAGTLPVQDSGPMNQPGAFVVPSARDVLADMPSADPSTSSQASGSPNGTQISWEGMARKLILKRNPEFPSILSANGQEVEGEAKISVAPSGMVTRVEITRSSGYIEIDASIEAALRDYLYTRVDGRTDTVGTVHFQFRLEKQD